MLRSTAFAVLAGAALVMPPLAAMQRGGRAAASFVRYDAPALALEHVRLIDGTGAPARDDQTIVIRAGRIESIAPSARARVPDGATRVQLQGRTVYPGLVGLHSHLFLFTYGQQTVANPRLYLAAGVTTAQTSGGVDVAADLAIKRDIDAGRAVAPRFHVTGPLMNGPVDGEEPEATVKRLADEGVASFKIYTQATRSFARRVIGAAHARGLKVLIHPCAITWQEAVALGVDSFAHGFSTATDFVSGKQPDVCPPREQIHGALVALDANGPQMTALYRTLIDRGVTVNSTIPVIESFTPHRQPWLPRVLPFMTAELQKASIATVERQNASGNQLWLRMLKKEMEFERAFVAAGGLMTAGSDATGPAMLAGFSDLRELELLVEAGFTAIEAIRISTYNGARYLGAVDRIGSLEAGKLADIVVVNGDPTRRIEDIEQVELVFKDGIGYDAERLRASVQGTVGRSQ